MNRALLFSVGFAVLLSVGCGEKEPEASESGTADQLTGTREQTSGRNPAPRQDTVESLANRFGKELRRMTGAMSSVTDGESAREAAQTVALVERELRVTVSKLELLEPPSEEVKIKINDKMLAVQDEMIALLGGRKEFLDGLDEGARNIIDRAMDSFDKTMGELDPTLRSYFEVTGAGAAPPVNPATLGRGVGTTPEERPLTSPQVTRPTAEDSP